MCHSYLPWHALNVYFIPSFFWQSLSHYSTSFSLGAIHTVPGRGGRGMGRDSNVTAALARPRAAGAWACTACITGTYSISAGAGCSSVAQNCVRSFVLLRMFGGAKGD